MNLRPTFVVLSISSSTSDPVWYFWWEPHCRTLTGPWTRFTDLGLSGTVDGTCHCHRHLPIPPSRPVGLHPGWWGHCLGCGHTHLPAHPLLWSSPALAAPWLFPHRDSQEVEQVGQWACVVFFLKTFPEQTGWSPDYPALTLLWGRSWSRWCPEGTSNVNFPVNTDWIEADCSLHLPT